MHQCQQEGRRNIDKTAPNRYAHAATPAVGGRTNDQGQQWRPAAAAVKHFLQIYAGALACCIECASCAVHVQCVRVHVRVMF